MPNASPGWSGTTKALVALVAIGLLAALMVRFHAIIPLIVVALILSYLILPLIRLLHRRLRFSWALATNLCFFVLLLVLIGVSTATGFAVVQQLQALLATLQRILASLPEQVQTLSEMSFALGPWTFDFSRFDLALVTDQAISSVQPFLRQVGFLIRSLATVAIESLGRLLFVLAVGYFLTLDHSRLMSAWSNFSVPGYEDDLRRLRKALENTWNSFLRGQLIVVMVTGLLTWGLMTVLGVRYALALGLLGGLAKFIPIVGPTTAGLIAALVSLFQPTHIMDLEPVSHALVVVLAIVVLDQMIDYILLPRIMGTSLNLHPVTILVGAIVGASLAGIIGLLLSAPSMASFLLLSRYAYRKMTDISPWDPPIDARPERAKLRRPRWLGLLRWRRRASDAEQSLVDEKPRSGR